MQIFDFCSIFHKIPKTDIILVLFIIVLDGLSVMKVVWRINNASKNFRGGEMLNVNSVVSAQSIERPKMTLRAFWQVMPEFRCSI